MLGSAPARKRNPIISILVFIVGIIVVAALCFLLCDALYLLDQATMASSTS